MNNNKKQSNLQFTKLTPDDIVTHEDLYISLLVGTGRPLIDKKYLDAYCQYEIDEVIKTKQLFQNTFG